MSTDRYTKVVLTVIAAGVLWLCASGAGRPVQAQQGPPSAEARPQPVVVVGWGTMATRGRVTLNMKEGREARTDPNIPVNIVGYVSPLNVRLEYTETRPLPVGISQIKRTGEWEPIRSSAEEEPVRTRPGGRQ